MKLRSIAQNQTEITTETHRVLFSYETPVACFSFKDCRYFRTEKSWSVTTTKHINKWLDGVEAAKIPQSMLDGLA